LITRLESKRRSDSASSRFIFLSATTSGCLGFYQLTDFFSLSNGERIVRSRHFLVRNGGLSVSCCGKACCQKKVDPSLIQRLKLHES
jgi:hypothetical protein